MAYVFNPSVPYGWLVDSGTGQMVKVSDAEYEAAKPSATPAASSPARSNAGGEIESLRRQMEEERRLKEEQARLENERQRAEIRARVEATNPGYAANPDFVNAVFRAYHGRDANQAELNSLVGTGVGSVRDTVRQGAPGTSATPAPSMPSADSAAQPAAPQGSQADPQSETLQWLSKYLADNFAQGKVINPEIDITPEITTKFMSQAESEAEPYYANLIRQTRQDMETAMSRAQQDFGTKADDIGRQFGFNLENVQESFARRGLEYSSDRSRAEQDLAGQAQRDLSAAAETTARAGQDIGNKAERYLGTQNLPSQQYSVGIGREPILGKPGVYGLSGPTGTRTLFEGSGNVPGAVEREKTFDVQKRVNDLIQAERQYRSGFYQ